MRFQKRYERKNKRNQWKSTTRSTLLVLVLCSVTYGWVAHIKNSGSFIPVRILECVSIHLRNDCGYHIVNLRRVVSPFAQKCDFEQMDSSTC